MKWLLRNDSLMNRVSHDIASCYVWMRHILYKMSLMKWLLWNDSYVTWCHIMTLMKWVLRDKASYYVWSDTLMTCVFYDIASCYIWMHHNAYGITLMKWLLWNDCLMKWVVHDIASYYVWNDSLMQWVIHDSASYYIWMRHITYEMTLMKWLLWNDSYMTLHHMTNCHIGLIPWESFHNTHFIRNVTHSYVIWRIVI